MTAALLATLLGFLIGSFLNVCIYRLPRERSIIKPRSYCPQCRSAIAWYDNIPLLSYAILRGACRHCQAKIPCRYPLVEALTGVTFGAIVWLYGPTLPALRLLVLSSILIALAFTDLSRRILPNELTLGGAALGVVLSGFILLEHDVAFFVLHPMLGPIGASVASSLIGALVPCSILGGVGWIWGKIRGMEVLGLGDVKMIATVGAFLGLQSTLAALVISSLLGVVIGSAHILLTKRDFTYQLPYGTYISIGTLGFLLGTRHLFV